MRRHIALMAITTVAVATMSFGAASAGHSDEGGQYSEQAAVVQAAFGKGTFQGGGSGWFEITKLQGGEVFAPNHVLPEPTADAPTVFGSFPSAASGGPPRYVGCIYLVNKKRQRDGGCEVIDPSSATFDPALRSGAIAFSVASKIEGFSVSATAFLSATTDPQPVPTHGETINGQPVVVYDMSGDGTPLRIELKSGVAYRRSAKMLGSIRSDVISGGGPFKKVTKSEMSGGLNSTVVIDRTRPFCANRSKPGDMPQDGPPSVKVPKPDDIDKPTAEEPMPSLPTDTVQLKFCPNDL